MKNINKNNNKHKTFFTSDLHFGHTNIIHYCNRPWRTAKEEKHWLPGTDLSHIDNWIYHVDRMDNELINNWNSIVGQQDTVYCLGDFTFGDHKPYLNRLNGYKILICGNHDKGVKPGVGWKEIVGNPTDGGSKSIVVDKQRIILSHYSMRVWQSSHHGTLNFYGHSHGTLPGNSQQLDVGVDSWDYFPVSLGDIQRRLKTLPNFMSEDYHGT